jgi:hypothetical protein
VSLPFIRRGPGRPRNDELAQERAIELDGPTPTRAPAPLPARAPAPNPSRAPLPTASHDALAAYLYAREATRQASDRAARRPSRTASNASGAPNASAKPNGLLSLPAAPHLRVHRTYWLTDDVRNSRMNQLHWFEPGSVAWRKHDVFRCVRQPGKSGSTSSGELALRVVHMSALATSHADNLLITREHPDFHLLTCALELTDETADDILEGTGFLDLHRDGHRDVLQALWSLGFVDVDELELAAEHCIERLHHARDAAREAAREATRLDEARATHEARPAAQVAAQVTAQVTGQVAGQVAGQVTARGVSLNSTWNGVTLKAR